MRRVLAYVVAFLVCLPALAPAWAQNSAGEKPSVHRNPIAKVIHPRLRKRRRTKWQHAKLIGGTAKTGASVGGMVGGPPGMAVGAAAGAAAGTAYDLKTRKKTPAKTPKPPSQ